MFPKPLYEVMFKSPAEVNQSKATLSSHQVLSILITAPLGAISIVFLGPRLLEKQEQNAHLQDQEQNPHLQKQEPKPPTFEEAMGETSQMQLTKETKELP